ncbi:MAG: 4Fe-4S dicluster domain-containing protein [Magnetococcales bacterium]|nr:4Fe-4S dicluster domain-containing protein [Magnetococcales bacterium]
MTHRNTHQTQGEELHFDVLIVGAGPSGLAAAIHLAQADPSRSIALLDKGRHPGAHILSGAIMDPKGMNLLLPGWQQEVPWPVIPVTEERFVFLTPEKTCPLPHFNLFGHGGCCLVSLGKLCRWLSQRAEALGVHVFFGFCAQEPIWDTQGILRGVVTGDRGRNRDCQPMTHFQPGVRLLAPITLIAEGARGHLASILIQRLRLDQGQTPQHYALGLKEVWEIPAATSRPGTIGHAVGWPLGRGCHGGGFAYHSETGRIDLGLVVDLDYPDPRTDPFALLQCLKTHPWLRSLLARGRPLEAGARVLVKGGVQSLPNPAFPGGFLIGDAAGFLDGTRMKGIHQAILSGVAAATTILELGKTPPQDLAWGRRYRQSLHSLVLPDLIRGRNVQPGMAMGLWPGMLHGFIDQSLFRGHAPWTLRRHRPDRAPGRHTTSPAPSLSCHGPMVIDRDRTLFLAGVRYRENQPPHVRIQRPATPQPSSNQTEVQTVDHPEHHYCPAGVFSSSSGPTSRIPLRSHRCLHCQTCSIKDPDTAIFWQPPEGGDGPHYQTL